MLSNHRAWNFIIFHTLLMTLLSGSALAEPETIRAVTVAAGLNHPWSLAFLPSGDLLVTERNGGLRIIHDGKLESKPISGVPSAYAEGDGGLLGLALHPDFAHNGLLYVCMSIGTTAANATSVIRGRLVGTALKIVRTS
jgi:glucose/arabinose dehydrogenase